MASRTDARPRTRLGREERREQLIAAATQVFGGRDPNDVTFEEVAEAAGVSRALVYNYFGDRHGLIEAVHLRHINDLRARVNHALSSVRDRRVAIRRIVREHLEYARRDPVGYAYAVGAPAPAQQPRLDSRRVDDVAAAWGGGVEAELLARGLLAAVRSMTLHWLDSDGPDIDRAEDLISQFVWNGAAGASELGLELKPWVARAASRRDVELPRPRPGDLVAVGRLVRDAVSPPRLVRRRLQRGLDDPGRAGVPTAVGSPDRLGPDVARRSCRAGDVLHVRVLRADRRSRHRRAHRAPAHAATTSPRRVARLTSALERGDLSLRMRILADEHDRRFIRSLLQQILLTFLGATTGITAALLLGTSGGPEITETVSLLDLVGYNLLLISVVLVLRGLFTSFRNE